MNFLKTLKTCYTQSVKILNYVNMEGISIFIVRKGTFREDSVTIV